MDLGIIAFKGILNTLVRLTPLSLYMGSIMSSLMYDNKRAGLLLLGFFLMELISGSYFMISKATNINPQCGLIKSSGGSSFNLPAPVPTSVGFFVGFMISEMFLTDAFKPTKFYFLIMLLLVSIWSRINVGCHSLIESCMAGLIGLFMGVGYLNLIKDSYIEAPYEKLPNDISSEENKIYQLLNLN